MTTAQLKRWRELGFEFGADYDEFVEVDYDSTIVIERIEIYPRARVNKIEQTFEVEILLNSVPTNHTISVEVNGNKFSQSYQKIDLRKLNSFYINAFVILPVPYAQKNFALKIYVMENWSKKLTSTVSKNIKVNDDGTVLFTNEKVDIIAENVESIIKIDEFNKVFKRGKLFYHKNMKLYIDVYNLQAQTFMDSLNRILISFGIDTKLRFAHFLSQSAQETADLSTSLEDGNDSYFKRYENRKDLGNNSLGDGLRFKGRGLLHLTGRENYKKFSKFNSLNSSLLVDFTIEPNNILIASNLELIIKSAAWFWQVNKGLSQYADDNDLIYITYKINGGFNGFLHRKEVIQNLIKAMDIKDADDQKLAGNQFKIEDSKVYNTFASINLWAKYHDSKSPQLKGTGKDKIESTKAYSRVIELYDDGKINDNKANKKIYEYAKSRVDDI